MSVQWRHAGSRVGRLVAALVLAAAGGIGLGVVGAGPAAAATAVIDCDQAAQPSSDWSTCTQIVGTASCVWDNGDGSYTAALGYVNQTGYELDVAAGQFPGNNYLQETIGSKGDLAHISAFPPGTSTTAFTVTWSPRNGNDGLQWNLMGHTYRWFAASMSPCAAAPVPVQNPVALTVLSLFLVVPVGWVLLSRRSTVLSRRRRGAASAEG